KTMKGQFLKSQHEIEESLARSLIKCDVLHKLEDEASIAFQSLQSQHTSFEPYYQRISYRDPLSLVLLKYASRTIPAPQFHYFQQSFFEALLKHLTSYLKLQQRRLTNVAC